MVVVCVMLEFRSGYRLSDEVCRVEFPSVASVQVMFMVSVAVSQNQIDIASKPQAIHRGLEAPMQKKMISRVLKSDPGTDPSSERVVFANTATAKRAKIP